MKTKADDKDSAEEIARRMDAALKRSLSMPPMPKKAKKLPRKSSRKP